MVQPLTPVPKSISYALAAAAKEYFDGVLNYSQPCPVYKLSQELVALRTKVSSTLSLNFDDNYVKASLSLFSLKNVNDFVKKIHKKANLSPESEARQKELNRLTAVAAKARKERGVQEKAVEEATRISTLRTLDGQADSADMVLARARVWASHFYSDVGVAVAGIVLLTENENNLVVLKTDIDLIFNHFRGQASIISQRCRQIVIDLERIMDLLRAHECVQHMAEFLTIYQVLPIVMPATDVTPPKQHRGTTLGSKKWRTGDNIDDRVGGLKVLNGNLRNRRNYLDKKAELLFKLAKKRVVEEEKIKSSEKIKSPGIKTLAFSKEDAKKESLCPTKLSENNNEILEALIQAKAQELGELLQEQLQRRNNENEGANLMTIPIGTVTMLVADPSATQADGFLSYGVGKSKVRLFSDLMGQASHDCRQYTSNTKESSKCMKYALRARVTTSDS